jgi:hypothetical protein
MSSVYFIKLVDWTFRFHFMSYIWNDFFLLINTSIIWSSKCHCLHSSAYQIDGLGHFLIKIPYILYFICFRQPKRLKGVSSCQTWNTKGATSYRSSSIILRWAEGKNWQLWVKGIDWWRVVWESVLCNIKQWESCGCEKAWCFFWTRIK